MKNLPRILTLVFLFAYAIRVHAAPRSFENMVSPNRQYSLGWEFKEKNVDPDKYFQNGEEDTEGIFQHEVIDCVMNVKTRTNILTLPLEGEEGGGNYKPSQGRWDLIAGWSPDSNLVVIAWNGRFFTWNLFLVDVQKKSCKEIRAQAFAAYDKALQAQYPHAYKAFGKELGVTIRKITFIETNIVSLELDGWVPKSDLPEFSFRIKMKCEPSGATIEDIHESDSDFSSEEMKKQLTQQLDENYAIALKGLNEKGTQKLRSSQESWFSELQKINNLSEQNDFLAARVYKLHNIKSESDLDQ